MFVAAATWVRAFLGVFPATWFPERHRRNWENSSYQKEELAIGYDLADHSHIDKYFKQWFLLLLERKNKSISFKLSGASSSSPLFPFPWGMYTWGGTQGEAVADPCHMFSLPLQLSWMTAALKRLVFVLKTVDLFLTSGCSFCEIRLGCGEIQLCKPGSQEHGKTLWWLSLSLKFFMGYELVVTVLLTFSPVKICSSLSCSSNLCSVTHTQNNCQLHKEANTPMAIQLCSHIVLILEECNCLEYSLGPFLTVSCRLQENSSVIASLARGTLCISCLATARVNN